MRNKPIILIGEDSFLTDSIYEIIQSEFSYEIEIVEYNYIIQNINNIPAKHILIFVHSVSYAQESIFIKKALKRKNKILLIDNNYSHSELGELIKFGVQGVITTRSKPKSIIKAVHELLNNKKYFCNEFTQSLFHLINTDDENKNAEARTVLTKKEFEVYRYLLQNKTSKEISSIMEISSRTVDKHRENIRKKMNVKRSSQLIKLEFDKIGNHLIQEYSK